MTECGFPFDSASHALIAMGACAFAGLVVGARIIRRARGPWQPEWGPGYRAVAACTICMLLCGYVIARTVTDSDFACETGREQALKLIAPFSFFGLLIGMPVMIRVAIDRVRSGEDPPIIG